MMGRLVNNLASSRGVTGRGNVVVLAEGWLYSFVGQ
jgi:hypothetical protein